MHGVKIIEIKGRNKGAWLAQLVEHVALDLGVVSSNPMCGVEFT